MNKIINNIKRDYKHILVLLMVQLLGPLVMDKLNSWFTVIAITYGTPGVISTVGYLNGLNYGINPTLAAVNALISLASWALYPEFALWPMAIFNASVLIIFNLLGAEKLKQTTK